MAIAFEIAENGSSFDSSSLLLRIRVEYSYVHVIQWRSLLLNLVYFFYFTVGISECSESWIKTNSE